MTVLGNIRNTSTYRYVSVDDLLYLILGVKKSRIQCAVGITPHLVNTFIEGAEGACRLHPRGPVPALHSPRTEENQGYKHNRPHRG